MNILVKCLTWPWDMLDRQFQRSYKAHPLLRYIYLCSTSLAKALSGSVINKDKQLADSLLACCQNNIKAHPDYGRLMIPFVISYTIAFGTEEEIKRVADLCYADSLLSDRAKLNIAYGYSQIGEATKALQVLGSIHEETIGIDSLKYFATKTKVLEANNMSMPSIKQRAH